MFWFPVSQSHDGKQLCDNMGNFSPKYSQQTTHILPVRVHDKDVGEHWLR